MKLSPILGLLIAAITFLASMVAVSMFRRWALHRHVLDIPNLRSSHTVPTPRGGGLPIVSITIVGLLIYQVLFQATDVLYILGYGLGALVVAGVSWIDDLHSLPNRTRFVAHLLAAIVGITTVGYWHEVTIPLFGTINLGWVGLPITLMWIIGLINAYNFMDGIDGIAGSQAVVGGIGWLLLGYLNSQPVVIMIGLMVAFSSLGFLVFNWPPAIIFMGDVGSAFLGYTFAILPLISNSTGVAWSGAALSGFLILWPFIADAAMTFIRRLLVGEDVFKAHRSHKYQRLVITGHSHRAVTLLYTGLSSIGVVAAIALRLISR